MKHFFKLTILASVVTALIFGLSAFSSTKKTNAAHYVKSVEIADHNNR